MIFRKFIVFGFITCGILATSVAAPKDDKKKETENSENTSTYIEGVVYSLPRTLFRISVDVQKETFIPGPYAAYAKRYLGITDASQEPSVRWNITGITIDPVAEPDPEAMYKAMDSVASLVTLAPDGRLLAINAPLAQVPPMTVNGSATVPNDNFPKNIFTDLSSDDFYDVILDSVSGKESIVTKSIEAKAQEAADYLIRIRKKRAYTIINPSDATPEDGQGYGVFINEAQRLEKEYTALFIGKTFTSGLHFTFFFVPGSKEVKNEVIFRFSEDKGILPKEDTSGKPIVADLIPDHSIFSNADKLKESENQEAGVDGIYYRIPAPSDLTISNGTTSLYSGRFIVAQLGVVAPLPQHFLNGRYSVSFDANTGNIKSVAKAEARVVKNEK